MRGESHKGVINVCILLWLFLTASMTSFKRTCETFTVMNLSPYLLPVVTSGIEELALHSASYLPQFLQLVNG